MLDNNLDEIKQRINVVSFVVLLDKRNEQPQHNAFAYRHEEAFNIKLADVSVNGVVVANRLYFAFQSLYGSQSSQSFATIERHVSLRYKPLFENWIEPHYYPMLRNPISERCGKYLSQEWSSNVEAGAFAWLVGASLDLCCQVQQIFFVLRSIPITLRSGALLLDAIKKGIYPSVYLCFFECADRSDRISVVLVVVVEIATAEIEIPSVSSRVLGHAPSRHCVH